MANRNDPSAIQITLLKELFEAHVGPLREDVRALRSDLRIDVSAVRVDAQAAAKRAEEAHDRLDDLQSRWRGIAWLSSTITAGIGLALTIWTKSH